MSFWKRLRGMFIDDEPAARTRPECREAGTSPTPSSITPAEEALTLLASSDQPVDPGAVAKAVASLRREGRELRAVELLGDALRARPGEEEIRAALAFLHVARLDFEAAAPLLETLTRSPRHGQRAEFVLGERAERDGDLEEALRRYERVLAKDVTHGQARTRAERLRSQLGGREAPGAQATMIQPEGVSTQSRYQLVRELGRGGAGAVYLARDTHLDRQVALKVYHPQVMKADGPSQLAREAALPARIGHPGIVQVLDVDPELGAVVMELIDGGSLKDQLRGGAMDIDRALASIEALCGALAALHKAGIVHRDVKPGNILFRKERPDDPVLTDLGVALLPGEDHEPGTGTPAYMAPEQRTEADIDARADVYAVGVMLAAMLGGYPGPKGPVGDLLDRCLSEAPGGRPRDAAELGREVSALRASLARAGEYQADMAAVIDLAGR